MNGQKAKTIRKSIYGDFSQRFREYTTNHKGAIVNLGKRRQYLLAKQLYKVMYRAGA